MYPFKEVVVATDFSETSARAVELAIEIAESSRAHLTVVHSFELPAYVLPGVGVSAVDIVTPLREVAEDSLGKALEVVRKRLPNASAILRDGPPWREILQVASDLDAGLVVVGTHGRRGLAHVLLGSVAEHVVRLSTVPVLTVGEGHGPGVVRQLPVSEAQRGTPNILGTC